MKWIQSFKLVKVSLLAVLAAGLSAALANAQEYEGTFTLPFEAHWGQATLPAGNYSFRLDPSVSPYTVTIRGQGGNAFVLATSAEIGGSSERSELLITRSSGKARIFALHVTDRKMGWTLFYRPPKAERAYLAHTPRLIQRVPVLMASR